MNKEIIAWLTEPYFKFLPYDFASLLAGIVWGRKEFLTQENIELFRQTGLLHLLVLSGQNITLLLSFFDGIPRIFGYRIRLFCIGVITLFYLFVFPTEPSIVRASIMALISSLVILLERETVALYIFFLTLGILFFVNPSWLTSISCWLSASATFGIIIVYPKLRSKNLICDQIALTLSAQLFTTPIILIIFRQYPLLSIFTNITIIWFVEPLMILGIVLSIIGHISASGATVVAFITHGLIQCFILLVNFGYTVSSYFILKI